MPESVPFARSRRKERARLARMIRHLRSAPRTIYELMEHVKTDRKTVWTALAYLRGDMHGPRRFRITAWRRISHAGPPTAVYGRGFVDDVPMVRASAEARRARKRDRHRAYREAARARDPGAAAAPPPPREDGRILLHIAGAGAGDNIEAHLDAIAARRAAAIQPRRDAMIWALFGAAQ